jgi:hypothetical protein
MPAATFTAGTKEMTLLGGIAQFDGCVDNATLCTVLPSLHP